MIRSCCMLHKYHLKSCFSSQRKMWRRALHYGNSRKIEKSYYERWLLIGKRFKIIQKTLRKKEQIVLPYFYVIFWNKNTFKAVQIHEKILCL